MGQPLLALGALEMHVRDLDAFDDTHRGTRPQRGAGVVRVDVRFERERVADDEQRIAEGCELSLEEVAIERIALDDEDGAVPIAGAFLVNRVRGQRDRRGGLRERLAGDVRGDPAQDLDEPRGTRIDDACLPEHLELLLRPGHRSVSVFDERVQQLR
jgi:hypothetical protein